MHVFTSRQTLCPSGYLEGANYHWDLDFNSCHKESTVLNLLTKDLEPHGDDGGDKDSELLSKRGVHF